MARSRATSGCKSSGRSEPCLAKTLWAAVVFISAARLCASFRMPALSIARLKRILDSRIWPLIKRGK
eukprot:14313411-Heterocapsa_arctica.AAC.1